MYGWYCKYNSRLGKELVWGYEDLKTQRAVIDRLIRRQLWYRPEYIDGPYPLESHQQALLSLHTRGIATSPVLIVELGIEGYFISEA